MMTIPNVSGISPLKATMIVPMRKPKKRMPIPTMRTNVLSQGKRAQKSYVEAVDLLITDYNDKAFIYNSGKVDILKNGDLKTVKFKSKKEAALYLMKTGWKYV